MDKGVKIAQPDLYYGERDKLESWLTQISLYLAFMGDKIPANKHPTFAITYLRGRAQKWIEPFLKKYMEEPDEDENAEIKRWMESAARFRVEIRRMFGPSNEVNAATRIIQNLHQKKSASEYSTQFQQYAAKTDWDDTALMVMYRRGLKENVKDELMRFGGVIDTLDQLIENAIEIDDKLFERTMEKRHDGGTSGEGRSTFFAKSRSYRPNHKERDPYGHTPMELDFTHKKAQSKGKKQHRGKKAFNCYSCGKPGHMAKDCRSKNMVHRPQINVMEKKIVVSDEPPEERISPAWDEVESDIRMWHEQMRQDELDEESEQESASNFMKEFNSAVRKRYLDDDEEGANESVERLRSVAREQNAQIKEAWIQESLRKLRVGDGSKAQGKQPEQDQDEEEQDPEWDEALSETEIGWEDVQPPEDPTPGSTASREPREESKEERMTRIWQEIEVRNYRMDDFHWKHGEIDWSLCANIYCPRHEQARKEAGGLTYLPACGTQRWNYCEIDDCEWHLTRKRVFLHFPGHTPQWYASFRRELKYAQDTIECHMVEWHTCLHNECQKHMRQKQIAGFLDPEEGKD